MRGQSYYTGTIFEVTMDDFGGSVAGGGRYDKMIGKFTGQDTPACGFSIGFERIVMLLLENGYKVPAARREEGIPSGKEASERKYAKSTCNGEKRQRRRKTGTDRQYEEKQEVPERTAYRRKAMTRIL